MKSLGSWPVMYLLPVLRESLQEGEGSQISSIQQFPSFYKWSKPTQLAVLRWDSELLSGWHFQIQCSPKALVLKDYKEKGTVGFVFHNSNQTCCFWNSIVRRCAGCPIYSHIKNIKASIYSRTWNLSSITLIQQLLSFATKFN